jgi:hypothetical protein
VFHYLVATGYRRLARSERAWRVVDASGPQQEVAEKIARAVLPRVKRLRGTRRPAGPRTRPRKTSSSGATRRRR